MLKHEFVITMFDCFLHKRNWYIVMENPLGYIDLHTLIKQKGALDESFSREVIHHLLEAIEYCHSMGVFHRDIKSRNILAHPQNGRIKLIDFGCAAEFTNETYVIFSGIYTWMKQMNECLILKVPFMQVKCLR